MSTTLDNSGSATLKDQLNGSTLPYHSESTFVITPQGVRSSDRLGIFSELWAYRRVAAGLVQRQMRIRYKGSFIGVFWSMVPPLVQVLMLTIVFGYILNSGPHNFSAYMLCAFMPWTFFTNAVLDASASIVDQLNVLKKSYFPREILPIAAVASNMIHFGFGFIVFLMYRYILTTVLLGWPGLPPVSLLWLPVVLFDLVCFTTGIALVVSAWTTFYEDIRFMVSTGMQLLFYAMPILYFAEQIVYSSRGNEHVRLLIYHLYLANPLVWIVESFKQMFFSVQHISATNPAMLSAPFDWRYMVLTTFSSILTLVIGWKIFQGLKWKFVERP